MTTSAPPPSDLPPPPSLKILDRIKKLLAVAKGKGASAAEVATAAAEAARLMQLHKLTEADVPDGEAEGPGIVDLPAGADFLDSWRFVLITVVARSFMCEAVGLRQRGRRKVRVVGRREDVEVSLEVYRHLAEEVERLTIAYEGDPYDDFDDAWDDLMYSAGLPDANGRFRRRSGFRPLSIVSEDRRATYRDGLVAGVSTKLRQQKQEFEESSEKALTISRKSVQEIKNYAESKFANPKVNNDEVSSFLSQDEVDFARGFVRGQEIEVATTKKPTPEPPSSRLPPPPASKKKVIVQKWEESERGWGTRPDGYSLHQDEDARRRYVEAYWKSMPDGAPSTYSRPCGTAYSAEVDVDTVIEGDGLRVYEHQMKGPYPGDQGPDGWKSR